MTITYMAPKLRQALDDMQISRVKRTAVTVHDNASRVTPNLRQSTTTALRCVCAINWHVVVQHDIDFLWSILRTLVKAVRFQLKFWKIPGFSRAFICVIAEADFCAALWQKHKGSKGRDMHQQGKWKRTAVQCMQYAVGIKKFLRQWRVKTAEFSPVSVYSAVDKKKADDGTYSVLWQKLLRAVE